MGKNITKFLLPVVIFIGVIKPNMLPIEEQVKKMDLFLEAIGFGINSGSIKVRDKDVARKNILGIRKSLIETSANPEFDINLVINYLEQLAENNFFDFQQLKKSFDQDNSIIPTSIAPIEDKILNKKLDNLNEKIKNSSYSNSQQFFRKINKLDQDYNISKYALRISPYLAFGLHSMLITKEELFPQWRWLRAIKGIIGETPRQVTCINPKTTSNSKILEEKNSDTKIELSEQDLYRDVKKIAEYQASGTVSKQTFEPGAGLGSVLGKLAKFISIESKPLLAIVPSALMLPVLKRDFGDLKNFINTKKSKLHAYFTGEKYKAPGKFKSSTVKFKDIIGFDENKSELRPIINYFNNKKIFDLSGLIIDKGYLLIGNQESGSLLTNALAGEIKDCKIKEIHASALVTDLEQLVKDAETSSPYIILIKEIDWLSSQNLKPKDWNIISAEMDKCLTGSKQILIVATASNLGKVDNLFTSYNKLGNIIEIEPLHIETVKDFIKKELSNMALDLDNFNIDNIAQEAFKIPNVSYKQIISLIKRAVINAQSLDQPLSEDQIKLVL